LIHPALWSAHQLGRATGRVLPTGWPELDRALPGGGWPRHVLTELLLQHPGVGEMRLLAPALAAVAAASPDGQGQEGARPVMLFAPPALPCAHALAELGLAPDRLVVVHGREGARAAALCQRLEAPDVLWALEQALRSGHAGPVLAWLSERTRADALRRLQLAAQAHDGPVFLLRRIEARLKPSPAPLRLLLHPDGADAITVQLLKRRGPVMAAPLRLALPAPAALRGRRRAGSTVASVPGRPASEWQPLTVMAALEPSPAAAAMHSAAWSARPSAP
jgi:protein ImuA